MALLRSQAAKAEQRIGVLEGEVVALTAQAEQSSYEHELAQKVQHPVASASRMCQDLLLHVREVGTVALCFERFTSKRHRQRLPGAGM